MCEYVCGSAGFITWTIWRGCTDRVGKFPRPWMGTASPRIESKRCTWSQDNTQNRRLWSDAPPQDMATLTFSPPLPEIEEKELEISWTNVTALYPLSDVISPAAESRERVLSFTLKVGREEKKVFFCFFFWWSQRCGGESERDQPFPPVRADRIQSVWKEPIHKRV